MDILPIDPAALLYLSAFSVISISCIVIFAAVSPRSDPTPHPTSHNVYPISSSPAEEINAYTHFINYYSISKHGLDLENETTSKNSNQSLCHSYSSQKPHLDQQFSHVTLTFGSDKPEVYMKMASYAHHKLPCRCPCNHQSPELAPFPHISNTSTISTDLSAHNPGFDSDSLSTFASNKQLIPTADAPFSAQERTALQSSPSLTTKTATKTVPNHTWLVINDTSASLKSIVSTSSATLIGAPQRLIVNKNDLTCRIAYARMKTMIPFLDPALFLQWVALKIFISLYVLARGFYQQALRKPVIRRSNEQ